MKKPLAKLSPPRLSVVYPRHRLFERLDQWSDVPALWVHAPAGYGKTTLVASYLQANEKPICWYQVDEGDIQPASFFYYLGQLAARNGIKDLPHLTPEYRLGGVQAFARHFFRSFYSGLPDRSVWVLDSYENASCDELDGILAIALQEIPPGLQIMLTSRTPPSSPFARLLATQQLYCLAPDELLLNAGETAGIFDLHLPHLASDAILDIHQRTKGWAAGVMLLIEKHKQNGDQDSTFAESQQQILFDYFADEVFKSTSAELREILLKTAFVSQITSEMAVALTGNAEAWNLLDQLARRNYFTYRHDNAIAHFEYHPLFSDFLMKQARRIYDDEALRDLLGRSAQLLAECGQYEQAVKLCISSEDWPRAVEIILGQAQMFLQQGRDQVIYQWLLQLPSPLREAQPWLQFWLGGSTLATDPNLSYGYFERAYRLFVQQDDTLGTVISWLGCVDSIVYSLSQAHRLDQWLVQFDEQDLAHRVAGHPDLEGQLASRLTGILILRHPEHPQVATWYDKAVDALWSIDDINQRLFTGFYLFSYNIWRGDLVAAAALWDRLLQGAPADLPPFGDVTSCFARAWMAWSQGDYTTCQSNVDKGLQQAQQHGVYVWFGMSLMMGASNALYNGKAAVADSYLQQLTPEIFLIRDMDKAYYYNEKAAFHLAAGQVLQAMEAQKLALKTAEELGVVYTLADAAFGMAQIQHVLENTAEAEHYLQLAESLGRRYDSWTKKQQCALLHALFALDADREEQAQEELEALFVLIRQRGFITYNSLQPGMLSRLFAFCLRRRIGQDIIPDLINRYGLAAPKEESVPTWPWHVRIWALGRFALEVDGQSVDLSGNKHRRPCDLLKLLLANDPHGISESSLADALWPEREGDVAMRNLRTNLHRLRRLLGSENAVKVQQGLVRLNTQYCWSDTHQVHQLIQQIRTAADDDCASLRNQLREAYSGPFLPAEESPSILLFRNRLNDLAAKALSIDGGSKEG